LRPPPTLLITKLSCFGAYFCIGKNRDKTLRKKEKVRRVIENDHEDLVQKDFGRSHVSRRKKTPPSTFLIPMLSCFGAYFCIGKNRDKTLRKVEKPSPNFSHCFII
jgi:hypothetical protein